MWVKTRPEGGGKQLRSLRIASRLPTNFQLVSPNHGAKRPIPLLNRGWGLTNARVKRHLVYHSFGVLRCLRGGC